MWQVDESVTGSVNSFCSRSVIPPERNSAPQLRRECVASRHEDSAGMADVPQPSWARTLGSSTMHLRMPSIDRGVQSFIWAVVFFLFLYFGMVLIEVSKGTAFVISLLVGFATFLFVRTRGGDDPLDRP
jgi:hypothetical protein